MQIRNNLADLNELMVFFSHSIIFNLEKNFSILKSLMSIAQVYKISIFYEFTVFCLEFLIHSMCFL